VIVVAIVSDLILASRIEEAAARSRAEYRRVDSPDALPAPGSVDLLLVDWSARQPNWGEGLLAWRVAPNRPRVILFGPHTDLAAHDAARQAGLGPMWARSKLVSELPHILNTDRVAEAVRPAP
jgi:hypothetical protein